MASWQQMMPCRDQLRAALSGPGQSGTLMVFQSRFKDKWDDEMMAWGVTVSFSRPRVVCQAVLPLAQTLKMHMSLCTWSIDSAAA